MSARAMTRAGTAGVALIVVGLLILVGPVALILWMHRMYTTGVSVEVATGPLLPLWLAVGIGLLVAGRLLVRKARTSRL